MKKQLMIGIACLIFTTGCATSQGTYQAAAIGGALGSIAGVLIDQDDRWRGGAIGAAIGSIGGAAITEISTKTAREAVAANTNYMYRDQQTRCYKTHKKVWRDGIIVEDNIEEVCEGEKADSTY